MQARIPVILLAVLALLGIAAYSSTFVVEQKEQAIVLQFGDPKQVVTEPGLHFKLPFLQDVRYLDKRVLSLDLPPQEFSLNDQRRVVVDTFVRYRIVDPLLFIRAAVTEEQLASNFTSITSSELQQVIGRITLENLLSPERGNLMEEIDQRLRVPAQRFGVEIVDLRINRTELSAQVRESIFQRMRAERNRLANDARAKGQEQFQTITAEADREAIVIRAEATRASQVLRGEGDAEKTRILNEAYGKDPEFFAFYRAMQSYRESLAPENSYLVLTTNSEFFLYFQDTQGLLRQTPGAQPQGVAPAPAVDSTGTDGSGG